MNLKEARFLKGLSQAELARKAGVTQQALSLIEKGLVKPRERTRERIEKGLGWPITFNTTEEENE